MAIGVGIIGASGYAGAELLRLLTQHPEFRVQAVAADSQAGRGVTELYPHLSNYKHLKFKRPAELEQELRACRVLFSALPHGEGAGYLAASEQPLVIDLSGDFRLKDPALYKQWYGFAHPNPGLLGEWVYGLPELFRSEIRSARRIANPGCYATAVILALAPLAKAGWLTAPVAVIAQSGLSGAGRSLRETSLFSYVAEDLRAYKIAAHQHTPEMEQALSRLSGNPVKLSFVPQVAPLVRGIHALCSVGLSRASSQKELMDLFCDFYQAEPFVRISAEAPGTKEVRGSNYCALTVNYDARNQQVIAIAVLDNLLKGAAGQALQNANIALGLAEDAGLTATALFP